MKTVATQEDAILIAMEKPHSSMTQSNYTLSAWNVSGLKDLDLGTLWTLGPHALN